MSSIPRSKLRLLLAVPASVLLSLGVVACGGTSNGQGPSSKTHSAQASSTTPTGGALAAGTTSAAQTQPIHEDRDKDLEPHTSDGYYDQDDYDTPNYPYVASAGAERAVATLVKRYFAAAIADQGATACSLIYTLFAETIPETYGLPPNGSATLHGTTCAQVMTKFFKLEHRQLAVRVPTMTVTSVRVNENRGLALLHFNGVRARSIEVHRERGVWKIAQLLDTEVT